jgi:hypothetical protein
MKSSAPSAIALTLFMFFLVILAAFFFLLNGYVRQQGAEQEQQILSAQSTATEQALQYHELELTMSAVEGTRSALEAVQATSAAELVAVGSQLTNSDQTATAVASQSGDIAATQESLEATATFYENSLPSVVIVEPQDGSEIVRGEPLTLVIVASDPAGVRSINVNVGAELLESPAFEEGPSVVIRPVWEPQDEGDFAVTVTAINNLDVIGPNDQITVRVIAPPTETPAPTITPGLPPFLASPIPGG